MGEDKPNGRARVNAERPEHGRMPNVQYRPTAAELLGTVASLLDDEVMGAVPAVLQHKVRVAANLCRIVQREVEMGGRFDDEERHRVLDVLTGTTGGETLADVRSALVELLNAPAPIDDEFDRRIYDALLETTIADLRIAKPGYDARSAP
jgi:hypothetical protein